MKRIIYILTFLLYFPAVFSQVTLEWQLRYNGTLNAQDAGNSVAVAPNGNICVAGNTYSSGGNIDYVVLVYTPQGTELWSATYNGPGDSADIATAITTDNSGNIYVTGNSGGSGTYRDFATIKYNSAGVQQWVMRYNGPGNGLENATAIMTDNSGNVYVVGYSRVSGTYEDYVTIKYTSAGVQEWVKRYNGPGGYGDWARGMDMDNAGNIYVTGESVGPGTSIDYCTVKYNPAGIQQWAARYHGTGNYYDFATAVAVDDSGNAYVTGYTFAGTQTEQDYCTIKYNTNGVQQWLATYNAPANSWEQAYYIALDNSGNVFVTGFAIGANSGTDYCTIKYNNSGQEQWVKTYNGPGNYIDEPDGLSVDAFGNSYVTGTSYGSGTGYDFCTIKYDNAGTVLWTERFTGTGNGAESCSDIAVDNNLNIYVTGSSFSAATNTDCITLKYAQVVGNHNITGSIPNEYKLYQNYPNPFNPKTVIKFNVKREMLNVKSEIQLIIYNSLGQEVSTLINTKLQPGTYEVEFDGTNYTSGAYFYKLSVDGNLIDTKKMILIK